MRKISVGELTSSCREFPENGKNGIHPLPAKLAIFGNCQAVNVAFIPVGVKLFALHPTPVQQQTVKIDLISQLYNCSSFLHP